MLDTSFAVLAFFFDFGFLVCFDSLISLTSISYRKNPSLYKESVLI